MNSAILNIGLTSILIEGGLLYLLKYSLDGLTKDLVAALGDEEIVYTNLEIIGSTVGFYSHYHILWLLRFSPFKINDYIEFAIIGMANAVLIFSVISVIYIMLTKRKSSEICT
jgi:hypothetical protein